MDRSECLRNRKILAKQLLNLEDWNILGNKITKFSPNIIVLMARRMPRIWQALKEFNLISLPSCKTVSHFAVPFDENELKGQRIAILDDSVNVGSSLLAIYNTISGANEIVCFATIKNGSTTQDQLTHANVPVDFAHSQPLEDDDYRRISLNLARVLGYLNRPFEIEFPVYTAFLSNDCLSAFTHKLGRLCKKFPIHKIDVENSRLIGLERYSIDLTADSGANNKFRVYLDLANQEFCLVPMANLHALDLPRHLWREKLFLASVNLARQYWQELKSALGLPDMQINQQDLILAFGPQKAEELVACSDLNDASDYTQVVQSGTASGPFLQEIEHKWEWINTFKQENKNSWQLFHCLHTFFDYLAEQTGSDNPAGLAEYFKSFVSSSAGASSRLCIGPSFSELVNIMGRMWDSPFAADPRKLHRKLSRLLDQQIDQGYVVPVQGLFGERCFRKGEPWPYDRENLELLRCMGKTISPTDNFEEIISDMSQEEQELFIKYRRKIENA